MLLFKVLTHPAVMLASIAIIIVPGEKTAVLFFPVFVMTLKSMGLFSILGVIGLAVLFSSYMLINREKNPQSHYIMNITGVIFLMGCIALFFYWIPKDNSSQAFRETIPLLTIIFAGICTSLYLIKNTRNLAKEYSRQKSSLSLSIRGK